MKRINLASLCDGMPGLTSACGTALAESAAVCLEQGNHSAEVQLQIRGMSVEGCQLDWQATSEQQRRCYNDLQEATEYGAYGIAILVVNALTGKIVIERARKGPGFDYWVGDADDDLLFSGKARLEVSGILFGDARKINARVAQKKNQISPSNSLGPGLIAVVEFGHPIAHVEVV